MSSVADAPREGVKLIEITLRWKLASRKRHYLGFGLTPLTHRLVKALCSSLERIQFGLAFLDHYHKATPVIPAVIVPNAHRVLPTSVTVIPLRLFCLPCCKLDVGLLMPT